MVSNTVWIYVDAEKDIQTKYTVKAYNTKPLPRAASLSKRSYWDF